VRLSQVSALVAEAEGLAAEAAAAFEAALAAAPAEPSIDADVLQALAGLFTAVLPWGPIAPQPFETGLDDALCALIAHSSLW
jgi:hypothetical protein